MFISNFRENTKHIKNLINKDFIGLLSFVVLYIAAFLSFVCGNCIEIIVSMFCLLLIYFFHKMFRKTYNIIFVSEFLFLFVGEIYFRVKYLGVDSVRHFYNYATFGIGPHIVNNTFTQFKPNYSGYLNGKTLYINNFGLRDNKRKLTKDKNTIRIIVLGSSHSMGLGINQEEMYSVILEKLLNKNYKGKTFEVINLSHGNFFVNDFIFMIENYGLKFNPDVIVIESDVWSDVPFLPIRNGFKDVPKFKIHEDGIEPLSKDTKSHPKNKIERIEQYIFKAFKKPCQILFFATTIENVCIQEIPNKFYIRVSKLFPQTQKKIEKLTTLDASFKKLKFLLRDKDVYIVPIAVHAKGRINRTIKELCKKYSFKYIEIKNEISSEKYNSNSLYPGDNHPNARLHKVYAETIFEILKQRFQ